MADEGSYGEPEDIFIECDEDDALYDDNRDSIGGLEYAEDWEEEGTSSIGSEYDSSSEDDEEDE